MLEQIQSSLPLGIFELDDKGCVLAYSTYKSVLEGRNKNEIVGKNFFTELTGMSGGDLEGCFRRVYRDRIPFNKMYVGSTEKERQSVLMMFFPDTLSVMVKVDKASQMRA